MRTKYDSELYWLELAYLAREFATDMRDICHVYQYLFLFPTNMRDPHIDCHVDYFDQSLQVVYSDRIGSSLKYSDQALDQSTMTLDAFYFIDNCLPYHKTITTRN